MPLVIRFGRLWSPWFCALNVICLALISPALLAQPAPKPVQPQVTPGQQGRQVALRDQLRVGLKAKTAADLAFIDLVVLRVDQGKLPRKMVDGTFLWARNRYKRKPSTHQLRPIVYFQPALTLQAKKLGILL